MLNGEEGREEKGDGRWKTEDGSDWLWKRIGKYPRAPLFLCEKSFRWSPPFGKGRSERILDRFEKD
jgi:hypothetical protein